MVCFGPKATPIVAVIGFVLDIAIAIFFVYYQELIPALPFLIIAFGYLVVVFGHIERNCSLFLPFLALKPLGLIVGVLLFIMSLCLIIFINMAKNIEKQPFSPRESPFLTYLIDRGSNFYLIISITYLFLSVPYVIIFVIVMGLSTALHAWFYSIIFRAYVLVKEKSAQDNANSEGYDDVAAGPTCCCGPFRARIETGIPVVALIGFFFQLSAAVMAFFYYNSCVWLGHGRYCYVALSFGLASATAYLVVFFAQRERNPSLFLPYLIIMPIAKVASVSFWILLFVGLIKLFSQTPSADEVRRLIPAVLLFNILPLLFLFSITLLHTWFYSLIFRAYKKTKQQKSASFITSSSSQAEESRVGP